MKRSTLSAVAGAATFLAIGSALIYANISGGKETDVSSILAGVGATVASFTTVLLGVENFAKALFGEKSPAAKAADDAAQISTEAATEITEASDISKEALAAYTPETTTEKTEEIDG